MRCVLLLALSILALPALPALAAPGLAGEAETLCAANPAYSPRVMLAVVQSQLQHDHDPALDADTPEKLAQAASVQGISECASDLRADPASYAALSGLAGADAQVGWDAYNTACSDHKVSRGACITAEVGAARALKRMVRTNSPPGSAALVQTCELVMQTDPAMADWRQCVDQALALHPTDEAAKRCKTSVSWHTARTGADAARIVGNCLRG